MMLYGKSEQNQYKGINLLPTGISKGEIIEVSIPKGTRIFGLQTVHLLWAVISSSIMKIKLK